MISIRDLIYSSNSDVMITREMIRDRNVRAVYDKYPDLEEIDNAIVSARTTGLIAIIDNNVVEMAHSKNLERQLVDKRNRFLARNDISPDFDSEKVICDKCNDTGFFMNKGGHKQVCKCRQSDVEECYRLSGLKDFSMMKLENYKDDYFGNGEHRKDLRKKLISIVIGTDKRSGSSLSILSDGIQTGKTFLAVYTAKLAINLGYSAYYLKLDDLANIYEDDLEDLKNYDILLVDDYIANMSMTGMIGTRLNSVLESRIATLKPTVIVTSFQVTSLIAESDVRISGKLKGAKVL